MNCQKCKQQITQRDKSDGNYKELFSGISHELCPGTKCFVCGETIKNIIASAQSMAGSWRHKSCQPQRVKGGREPVESPQEIERWYEK